MQERFSAMSYECSKRQKSEQDAMKNVEVSLCDKVLSLITVTTSSLLFCKCTLLDMVERPSEWLLLEDRSPPPNRNNPHTHISRTYPKIRRHAHITRFKQAPQLSCPPRLSPLQHYLYSILRFRSYFSCLQSHCLLVQASRARCLPAQHVSPYSQCLPEKNLPWVL